jgi:hypothetical protein
MAEADRELRGGIDDCDLRFFHILVRDTKGVPLCPSDSPACCARLKVRTIFRQNSPFNETDRELFYVMSAPRNAP